MITPPFEKAIKIIETIESYQHEAYFVGGSIRDLILNKQVNDIDITTSAPPQLIKRIFDKVIPVGIDHGTVLVRMKGVSYEVTTYRTGNPEHLTKENLSGRLKCDLKRRDFTINALAMDKEGQIIDLFNGKQDIKNRLIKSVGSSSSRMTEDPLRIIRALRFASQLGFSIEPDTLNSMIKLKQKINTVSVERITAEFTKFFQGEHINNGVRYLIKTGVYKHLPILHNNQELVHKLPNNLMPLQTFGEIIALFHLIDPSISIKTWIKSWKGSNLDKHQAKQLVKAIQYYKQFNLDNLLIYRLTEALFDNFIRLTHSLLTTPDISKKTLNKMSEDLPIQSRQDIHFNGNDIIGLYPDMPKGDWINNLFTQIEEAIIMNQLSNDKKLIKEWVLCNPPEIN